ncbi:MAG: YggS family pyridoxal phosphate-dependent enzyme [Candidatus Saccharicenans sp.]|jgi:pyridoxal phosphate enzyme (YggS family)|nr:YggS family pyridoxal phosphate-dependent enzyme [Candidatus Saccharicenans sp.]MDH7575166.1 YggS family pyridoxal phosphate-dependent enzyme [Candidatus Saccharicenans sp.]
MNDHSLEHIKENVRQLLKELPPGVELVAAAKQQPPEKIVAAIEAGIRIIGENYVQEAAEAFMVIGKKVQWSFIGHLQKNKVKKAVEIFDIIETVDSLELAAEINKRCAALGKIMPVLIEVNSGREPQKFGALPEEVEPLARAITGLPNLKLRGLMTMGPFEGDPEEARPYFRLTRQLFEQLKALNLPGAELNILSMGMTNSYRVAIEEGANRVRLGTRIFGPRF